jgi:hypothetical protein
MSISTTFTLKFSGAAVERGLSRVQSAFKTLGGVAMRVGKMLLSPFAGIAAAVGGLVAGKALLTTAWEMNQIGEAATTSEARLLSITRSMGLFGSRSQKVADRISALADEQARLTGIDDETIRLTQSKLMTFKKLAETADVTGGAFDRATIAAMDMASAGFGSAENNAVQLGKALNDPIKGITALARSGITFTQAERDKIAALIQSNQTLKAQDMILRAIEKQVGGASIATSDASARMKQGWEQLKEEFAKPFSIELGQIFDRITAKIPQLAETAKSWGQSVGRTMTQIADAFEQGRLGSVIQNAFMFGATRAGEILIATSTFAGYALYNALAEKIQSGQLGKLLALPAAAGESPVADSLPGFTKFMPMGQFIRGVETFNNIANHLQKDGVQVSDKSFMDLITASQNALGSSQYQAALGQSLTKEGEVPNAPGFRYASPNEAATIMDGERVVRILDSIDRKLSPQP